MAGSIVRFDPVESAFDRNSRIDIACFINGGVASFGQFIPHQNAIGGK